MKTKALLFFISFIIAAYPLPAKVVRVEIKVREVKTNLPDIEKTGPYEILKGIIYLEVNPDDPSNEKIVDLKYAPRNKRGNVEFSSEFELHKPVDPKRGNHRLMYIVCNRGHKGNYFSWLKDRDWFYSKGWSYLYCGWQCDLEENDELYNLRVPVITVNGRTVTGRILFEFFNYEDTVVYSMPLVDKGSPAYPIRNVMSSYAALTLRQYPWDKSVEITKGNWQFARYENGKVIPDSTSVYINNGFKPGWLYDLVYEAKDPTVVGLGLATIRDVVSFFKYEDKDRDHTQNPLSGHIQYAFAYGHSQSGRLLNHFVYQNFNGDEKNRVVFDGIIANCPGAGKGEFNSRFAQPTRYCSHLEDNLYMVDFFPFNTVEQIDPKTGQREDAFERARISGFLPKIMIINSSTDYWTRGASLLHTDTDGKRDVAIDPSCRIYLMSGLAHTEGRIGVVGRALLVALDQWVSLGIQPPESRIPKIADGTLVDLISLKNSFPLIPELIFPQSLYRPIRLDPGARWKTEGIADTVPPREGPRYVTLVPQVDSDGNEIAGVRLPDIAVPFASFTGWKQRPLHYSNTLSRNNGFRWPFSVTKEERLAKGDIRKSIRERYPTKEVYVLKLTEHLHLMQKERLILDEDIPLLIQEADNLKFWN